METAERKRVIQLLTEIRDLLAGGAPQPETAHPRPKAGGPSVQHRADAVQPALDSLLGGRDTEAWASVWDHGSTLEKWLAVLAVAEEEVGDATALTGPEIARVLKERFRIAGVHATNVNRDLKTVKNYVNRRPRGRAFEYSLTRPGLKWVKARRAALGKPA